MQDIIKHFESIEESLKTMSKEEYTNSIKDIQLTVSKDINIYRESYVLEVIRDKNEIYEALDSISNYPIIWNKRLLIDLFEATKERWANQCEMFIIKLICKNWNEDRWFFPAQTIERKDWSVLVEWLWSWFVESKEIFAYTSFEKEIFRHLLTENFKQAEFFLWHKVLLWNTADQITKQMRFNYFWINTSNINSIDDYFSLLTNKKKRNRARACLKNLNASKDLELMIEEIDERFDIRWFLNWWIQAAKNNWKELLNHHRVYEEEAIKAYIKNWKWFNLKVEFKWKKIIDYIVVIIDWIMFDITWQMDNSFIEDSDDKRLTNEVSRYLIFQRIILALKEKAWAIFEWPWNFWWKKYACNLSSFVYYLNE